MLWGMGQMGPVLVSVSFTLNSVTKLNSVNPRARAEHLDTVLRAPADDIVVSVQVQKSGDILFAIRRASASRRRCVGVAAAFWSTT